MADRGRGRVAQVLPWPNVGGTELQTLRLAQTARTLGYDNLIYVPDGAESVAALFSGNGFPVLTYEQVQPSYTHPKLFWRNCRRMAASLREHGREIVHCSDIHSAHFIGWAARLAKARLISHVRNHYPSISLRDRSFLLPVERFICVSENTRDNFAMKRGRARARVLYDVPGIVYRPIDDREAARRSFGLGAREHVFGMAARVSPQKDFASLIEAAAIVVRELPECRFLIAGDHEIEAAHREHFRSIEPLLESTGMRRYFHFAGFQPDMSRFYAAIDTFVLSSNWEGLPTVVLEAAMYRRPVVSTRVGGIGEAITDGESGFLVPVKAPGELADRLLKLAKDAALAARFAESAGHILQDRFGEQRFQRDVDALYSSLAPRR